MDSDTATRRLDVVLFALMSLVWGSSFLFIKLSLDGFSPPQVAVLRSTIGAVTLLAVMAVSRRRFPRDRRTWAHMAVVAVTQCSIPFTLTSWVEVTLPSSLTSIYNAIAPAVTIALTPLLLRADRLRVLQVIGVLVGLVGIVILMSPWQIVDARTLVATTWAQVGILCSAAIYAFGLVYMRRFLAGTEADPVTISTMQVTVAAIPLLLLTPLTSLTPIRFSWVAVFGLVMLGVLGTGIAYLWSTRIVRHWGATGAATVTYLMPIVGVVLGIVVLGESLLWNEVVGGVLILGGVVAAQVRWRPGVRLLDPRRAQ